jgi:hypothetical protein
MTLSLFGDMYETVCDTARRFPERVVKPNSDNRRDAVVLRANHERDSRQSDGGVIMGSAAKIEKPQGKAKRPILKAAAKLFRECGFDRCTVRGRADEVGILSCCVS